MSASEPRPNQYHPPIYPPSGAAGESVSESSLHSAGQPFAGDPTLPKRRRLPGLDPSPVLTISPRLCFPDPVPWVLARPFPPALRSSLFMHPHSPIVPAATTPPLSHSTHRLGSDNLSPPPGGHFKVGTCGRWRPPGPSRVDRIAPNRVDVLCDSAIRQMRLSNSAIQRFGNGCQADAARWQGCPRAEVTSSC